MATTKQYKFITSGIIEALEESLRTGKNTAPWQKPWKAPQRLNRDRNAYSGHPYKGLNPVMLWIRAAAKGYSSKLWLTYAQAEKLHGYVKRGEKSTVVYFWKFEEKEKKNPDTGEWETKTIPILKTYPVFNLDQTENVKLPKRELEVPEEEAQTWDAIKDAQAALDAYINQEGGPSLAHNGGNDAFYRPAADAISLPKKSQFPKPDEYYATAFHEAGHSTGHKSRLNRLKEGALIAPFGSKDYSKEEMVAELASAFVCAWFGIDSTRENSIAYISGWTSKIKRDPQLVVSAAGKAQKAADLIIKASQAPTDSPKEVTK